MTDTSGDRELDTWLAENVMGWRLRPVSAGGAGPTKQLVYLTQQGNWTGYGVKAGAGRAWMAWTPTTSHDQAFMVAEKVALFSFAYLTKNGMGEWGIWNNRTDTGVVVTAETAPLAICRAVKTWKESAG